DAEHPDDASLEGFLESASLVSDVDAVDENAGQVTLMTLHAAKGLEFPVVVIVAVEDRLLPHERSLRENNPHEIEEERRLLFVGITRAKERLYLTRTFVRDFRGNRFLSIPSRFLSEMPVVAATAGTGFDFGNFGGGAPAKEESATEVVEGDDERAEVSANPAAVAAAVAMPVESNAGLSSSECRSRQHPQGRPLLTTGADLLNGTVTPVDMPQTFSVGMSVRHPRLGVGSVIEAQGLGKWRTVTVVFSSSGETQSFVAHKCPLQPVGLG
ncbi:MAG TPA: 3'-5' exonuclease, partial [Planctomycetaceae bacterium]|nr:3'-5' exonuclease [Planctomycetaceae bacterium]